MQHKLFNIHKMKRQWGGAKKRRRTKRVVRARKSASVPLRRTNRRTNPYRRTRAKRSFSWSGNVRWLVLLCILLVNVGILIYHPFFHVKTVYTSGIDRIDPVAFDQKVEGILDYRRYFFLPAQNYFFVDLDELKIILNETYALSSITVQKSFPAFVHIDVEEKISNLIYDNGIQYSYLDMNGVIIETVRNVDDDEWIETTEMVTSTNAQGELVTEENVISRVHIPNSARVKAAMGDYPIIVDSRESFTPSTSSTIERVQIDGIIDWFYLLEKKHGIAIQYMSLDNLFGNATFYTKEGWNIFVQIEENIEKQVRTLMHLLENEIDRNTIQYVDLRYGERVFWK